MKIVKKIYSGLLSLLELLAVSLVVLGAVIVVYSSSIFVFLCLWFHNLVYLYFAIPCVVIGKLLLVYINKRGYKNAVKGML